MASVQKPPLNDVTTEYDLRSVTALSEIMPIAIYTCDRYGYISSYNKAAVDIWGRTPEIGCALWCGSWKIFYPTGEPMSLDDCPMARTLRTGIAVNGEHIVIQRPDGAKVLVKVYPQPFFDKQGQLTGAINTLIDISEQRADEEEKAMLATIIECADVPIISKNTNGI